MFRRSLAALILLLIVTPFVPRQAISAQGSGKPRYGEWGVALDARNNAVKPGDDFFRHANGTWFDKTPIDPDKSDGCARSCSRIRTARPSSASTASSRNVDAWYRAFDVKAGDKMYLVPEQRVRVW